MCLAQGYNTVTPMRLEPVAPRSRVKQNCIIQFLVDKMPHNYSFILSSWLSVIFYQNNLSIYSCDDQFKLHIAILSLSIRKMEAVTLEDNYCSLVMSFGSITIGRQTNLIDSVTD